MTVVTGADIFLLMIHETPTGPDIEQYGEGILRDLLDNHKIKAEVMKILKKHKRIPDCVEIIQDKKRPRSTPTTFDNDGSEQEEEEEDELELT
jgi:hypothetical protein